MANAVQNTLLSGADVGDTCMTVSDVPIAGMGLRLLRERSLIQALRLLQELRSLQKLRSAPEARPTTPDHAAATPAVLPLSGSAKAIKALASTSAAATHRQAESPCTWYSQPDNSVPNRRPMALAM